MSGTTMTETEVPIKSEEEPQPEVAPSATVVKSAPPAAKPPPAPVPKPAAPVVAKPTIVAKVPPPNPAAPVNRPIPPPNSNAMRPPSAPSNKSKKKKSPPIPMASSSQSGEKGVQGENVGRWTAEEHRLFLQGLEQHGKGWKKIASLIKTRSVVQIRTHAQKYFQKLSKARQNGEEGDVTMEGRGGVSSVASVSTAVAAQTSRRRRQTSGTKRKAIQSVVASAYRQGKKLAAAQAAAGVPNPIAPLPAIAPTLAHFVLPNLSPHGSNRNGGMPTTLTSKETICGPALEDSIFRFLSPAPVAPVEPALSEIARQAGANPITVPIDNPSNAPVIAGGEISPTGVSDLVLYPSWTDAKDPPSWYTKGGDVDALLDVADTLDWLADTGDLHETYQPPSLDSASSMSEIVSSKADLGKAANNTSVSTLPDVDGNVESVVPPLPSLFDGSPTVKKDDLMPSRSESSLKPSGPEIDDHLEVFENPMEEQDFMATILDSHESAASLPPLN